MSETTKTAKTAEERLAIRDERIKQLQKQKQKIRKDENKKIRKQRDNRLYRRHGCPTEYIVVPIDVTVPITAALLVNGLPHKLVAAMV